MTNAAVKLIADRAAKILRQRGWNVKLHQAETRSWYVFGSLAMKRAKIRIADHAPADGNRSRYKVAHLSIHPGGHDLTDLKRWVKRETPRAKTITPKQKPARHNRLKPELD